MGIEAITALEQNRAKYIALIAECDAEKPNLAAMDAQRQHNYEMKKAAAFEALGGGRNTNIVMSGSSGESLINKIFNMDA